MIHLSEGELQAFLDGESNAVEHAGVAAHIEGCAACRTRLHTLRDNAALFSRAFAAADLTPDVAAARAAVYRRARPERPAQVERPARPARPARPVLYILPQRGRRVPAARRAVLRAAVLVFLVAGAASATVPHWPVRRFLVGLWHDAIRLLGTHTTPPPSPVPVRIAPVPTSSAAAPAGVSVLPQDGRVSIFVRHAAPGLLLHVRVLDTDRASVEADGAAASAQFDTGPGRIEVTGAGAGNLLIGLPRATLHASVNIDDRAVFTRDAGQIRRLAPVSISAGETVFRVR